MGRHRLRRTLGASLVEMVAGLLILSFVTASVVSMYTTGRQSHRRARFYSKSQTEIRYALREMTRRIRTSNALLAQGTQGTLSGIASSSFQVVMTVPSGGGTKQCRYYVSNGILYRQTSTQSAPGTPILKDVVQLTFAYYKTAAGTRISATGAVGTATEVEILLQARYGSVTTGLAAYVTLRSVVAG